MDIILGICPEKVSSVKPFGAGNTGRFFYYYNWLKKSFGVIAGMELYTKSFVFLVIIYFAPAFSAHSD